MTPAPDRRFVPKLVIGLLMILAGIALVLENSGLLTISFWNLFIPGSLLLFGLAALWSKGPLNFGGHLLLFFGVGTLLYALGYEYIADRWWPVGFIWGGVVIVLRALSHSSPVEAAPNKTCQDFESNPHE